MASPARLKHTIMAAFGLPILVLSLVLFLPLYISYKLFLSLLPSDENVMNKVVLITGASSGIGEQLAYEYAKRGARLVLSARREQALKEVAMNSRNLGSPEVLAVPADVSKLEDCKDMDVNFWGSIYPTHYSIPHLRKSKGKIIVNASLAGLLPSATTSIYSAAQIRFYETLRQEVGSGVEFTIVTLGFVDTAITQGKFMPKDGRIRDNKEPPEVAKSLPRESAEECAKVMLRAACRGKRHLLWPTWFWLPLLTHTLLPEVNEWFARRRYVTG
ncbi:hypothetical protein ACLOJK_002101 [Asimina triloba]